MSSNSLYNSYNDVSNLTSGLRGSFNNFSEKLGRNSSNRSFGTSLDRSLNGGSFNNRSFNNRSFNNRSFNNDSINEGSVSRASTLNSFNRSRMNRSNSVDRLDARSYKSFNDNGYLSTQYMEGLSLEEIDRRLDELKRKKDRLCKLIVKHNEILYDKILELGKKVINIDGGYLKSVQTLEDSTFRTAYNILEAAKKIKHNPGNEFIKEDLTEIWEMKADILDLENEVQEIVQEKIQLKYAKDNKVRGFSGRQFTSFRNSQNLSGSRSRSGSFYN